MQWKDYIAAIAEKGVSQSQLAKQVGCGQATISDLASGKTREPRHSLGMVLLRVGTRHGVRAPKSIQPTTQGVNAIEAMPGWPKQSQEAGSAAMATQELTHG